MIKIIYAFNLCAGLVCLTYFVTKQEEGIYRCPMVTVTFGDDMWQDAHVQHAGGHLEKRLLVYSHFNGVYEEDGKFIDTVLQFSMAFVNQLFHHFSR